MSTIVITGANRGIGLEVSRQLVASGHDVWMGSRSVGEGEKAAQGVGGRFLHIDTTDQAVVEAAAERIRKESGVLDVLINNAGILGGMADARSLTAQELSDVYETNVFGAVRVIQAFLFLLELSESPSIINVTSESGSFASVTDPNDQRFGVVSLAYASSKAALDMLTVQYSKALPSMSVNAVAPGFTRTDFNGNTGIQTVEEGAEAIVQLAESGPDRPTGKLITQRGEIGW